MIHQGLPKKLFLVAFLCLCFSAAVNTGRADDHQNLRKASGVGGAYGFVVEADTHHYLSGAKITLALPSDMEPIKDSSNASDENGYYEIKAPLGEASSHFATDRIMELSIASLLSGGGKKVVHIINVSQMILTVSKPGYKTFYGTVPVDYADVDKFRVRLSPVVLMPEAKPYVSYADPHLKLGKIENATLSSPVLSRDEVVKYTVKASDVPLRPHTQISLWCRGSKGGFQEVKNGRPQSDMTFSGNIRIDKKGFTAPGLYALDWDMMDNDSEPLPCPTLEQIIAVDVPPANKEKMTALFSAAPSSATQFILGVTEPDKVLISQMAALLPADADLTTLTRFLNSGPTADGTPSLHQRAVNQNIASLRALIDDPHLPAYMKPALRKNLDRLTAASTAEDSPAQKRKEFDEQVASLKTNVDNPTIGTTAKMMLAHLYFSHGDFDQAWSIYEALFQAPDTKKKKDFYLFHDYGTLLFGRGRHQEAVQYLSQALANGHTASQAQDASQLPSQTFIGTTAYTVYTRPERTNTNGFAYPEADDDLLIVENDAEQEPNTSNWLSETVLGRALTEIGLTEQGKSILEKVVQVCPNQPEAMFALAFAQAKADEKATALATVNRGLLLNPNDHAAMKLREELQTAMTVQGT